MNEHTTQLKLTICLVFISIIGSFLSHFTYRNGIGNIYPFFDWKLYSQPAVTRYEASDWRIYSRKENQQSYTRVPIRPLKEFSDDEFMYTFNYWVSKTLADSTHTTNAKKNLFLFIKHTLPDAKDYKIVLEKYNPKTLSEDPLKYDTTTIITF